MNPLTQQLPPSTPTFIGGVLMLTKLLLNLSCALIIFFRCKNRTTYSILLLTSLSSAVDIIISECPGEAHPPSLEYVIPICLALFIGIRWLDRIGNEYDLVLNEDRKTIDEEQEDERENEIKKREEEKKGEEETKKEASVPIPAIPTSLSPGLTLALGRIYGDSEETSNVEEALTLFKNSLEKMTHIDIHFLPVIFSKVMRRAMNDILKGNISQISAMIVKKYGLRAELDRLGASSHVDVRVMIDITLSISEILGDCHEYLEGRAEKKGEEINDESPPSPKGKSPSDSRDLPLTSLDLSEYVEVDDLKETGSSSISKESSRCLKIVKDGSRGKKTTLSSITSTYQCAREEFSEPIDVKLLLTKSGKGKLKKEINNALASRTLTPLLACILSFRIMRSEH